MATLKPTTALDRIADDLMVAVNKLIQHGKEATVLGWPRESIVPYTMLRNAVTRQIEAYDRTVQQSRRDAHRRTLGQHVPE